MKKAFAKLTAVLTAAALILGTSGIGEAAYAQTASAISITLEKTVGTGILVTTAADRKLGVRDGMRLYNGYKVSTGVKSHAYLALDDKKAVKTDQLSRVQIKKEGRKNEIKVICGKLFFNVKEKLTKKETMKISTSNISMGIRGTSGSVAMEPVLDEKGNVTGYSQTVQIYDGSVQLETPGADTGEGLLVQAGEAATLTPGANGSVSIEKKQMEPSDIPSFAGEEMLSDEALLARVEQGSGFTVNEVKEGTESSRQEEEKQTELLTSLWENKEEAGPEYYDKGLSGESEGGKETDTGLPEGGGSGGGSGTVTTPAPAPTPEPAPTPTPSQIPTPPPVPTPSGSPVILNLEDHSDGGLLDGVKAMLENFSNIIIQSTNERTITINEQIMIQSSQTLTIGENVKIEIGNGGQLDNAGVLINKGKIEIEGGGIFKTSRYFLNAAAGKLENEGTMENSGDFINNGEFRLDGSSEAMLKNSGTIFSMGSIKLLQGKVINESKIIIKNGTLSGDIKIEDINGGKHGFF